MIKSPRGTRDLLPPDTALWNFVESTVRDVFRAYNFHEIRTPIFEDEELFARGVGEETDIVGKEMFAWNDGERFNKAKLIESWCKANASNVWLQGENLKYVGMKGPTIDRRVFWKSESILEFVSFAREATDSSIAALAADVQLARQQDPNVNTLSTRARIVTPSAVNRKLANPNPAVVVEELPGEFFESSQRLALRPENTAGVVRAYIEHKMWDRGLNKLFYIGPQFRRERPQKGRYRQFYQIGAEVIGPATAGSASPARDAEILELLVTLLERVGITNWTLELNSIGTPADREKFNEALRLALAPVVGTMCTDCQRRAVTNPLRVFDCKVPEDQPVIDTLPTISEFLSEESRAHFRQVKEILDALAIPYVEKPRLVRGLDYYGLTAFEFTHGALGAQNAILGGGRYDGLSEALGGPPAPGIGFAIGEDRLVLSLAASADSVLRKPDVYIAPLGVGMNREAARLARELRRNDLGDIVVELGDESFRLKKSFEAADKIGARYILIVGENEVKADAFSLKHLASGEQVTVPRGELAARVLQK
jgi:histidyl-tRNA synthetase